MPYQGESAAIAETLDRSMSLCYTLLPLLPLAHNGKRHEVVDAAIASLSPPGEVPDAELLVFIFEFASLVFHEASDREWLKRRLACSTISCAKPGCFKKLCRKGKK